jgi:hypothetical protein
MEGDLNRAEDLFEEAATLATERNASPPFLYNQVLYRYGYLMIETGRAADLFQAAENDPGWGLNGADSSPLSGAIRDLMHAAAQRSLIEQGELSTTRLDAVMAQVDRAMIEFRSIGYSDYVVRGLLERVHVLRTRRNPEDYAAALDDLDEVEAEVARGGMALLAADLHLHRAACHLAWWPAMTPRQQAEVAAPLNGSLRQAAQQVRDLGYGRRRPMLTELERQARTLLTPRQAPDRRLPAE